ncbi:MAG: class II aldolase/adducin family protein [Bacteroidales bacterium]|nr:class II aldolase/adducin family protein [Bacteroidales bacterium]
MELKKEREMVAATMRRLYNQKLTTASGGNVSLRADNKVLITASQIDKGLITGEQVAILTSGGNNLTPELKMSMEYNIHLSIYTKRPDVKAIVHAHPVFATGFAIAGKLFKTSLSGEFRAILGKPVLAKYVLMGTTDLAQSVSDAATRGNLILMANHGVLTTGRTLFEAYDRMEVAEACAKMNIVTGLIGQSTSLNPQQLREIDSLFS